MHLVAQRTTAFAYASCVYFKIAKVAQNCPLRYRYPRLSQAIRSERDGRLTSWPARYGSRSRQRFLRASIEARVVLVLVPTRGLIQEPSDPLESPIAYSPRVGSFQAN